MSPAARALAGLALLLGALGAAGCGEKREGAAVLPPGRPGGPAPQGAPRQAPAEGLTELIDGGAELYLEYGVESLVQQRYAVPGEAAPLEFSLFRFADEAGAQGAFSLLARGLAPGETPGWRTGAGAVHFYRGRHYCRVVPGNQTPPLAAAALLLARQAAGALPAGEVPRLPALPPELLPPEGAVFVRGTLALAHLAPLLAEALPYPAGALGIVAAPPGETPWILLALAAPPDEAARALDGAAARPGARRSDPQTVLGGDDALGRWGLRRMAGRLLGVETEGEPLPLLERAAAALAAPGGADRPLP